MLGLCVRDELGIHPVARLVHEVGDAQVSELLHLRHVADVRNDRDVLLLRLVDDRLDHVRREPFIAHPDFDEVDVQRLVRLHPRLAQRNEGEFDSALAGSAADIGAGVNVALEVL